MTTKALVLAYATTYQRFIKANHLNPREYPRVSDDHTRLYGYKDMTLLVLDDMFTRLAFEKIEQLCRHHNIDIIHVRGEYSNGHTFNKV